MGGYLFLFLHAQDGCRCRAYNKIFFLTPRHSIFPDPLTHLLASAAAGSEALTIFHFLFSFPISNLFHFPPFELASPWCLFFYYDLIFACNNLFGLVALRFIRESVAANPTKY